MMLDRLYAAGGYRWRNGEGPVVRTAHRLFDVMAARRPVWVESPSGDGMVQLAYAGLPEGVHLTLPFLEHRRAPAAGAVRTSVRRRWGSLLAAPTAEHTDLAVTGYDIHHARHLPQARSLTLPFRLALTVPLGDKADVLGRVSRKDRQQFVRQRQCRTWTLEVATREADFAYFYDHMHAPTMQVRHGESTRSERRAIAHTEIFRKGVLFFLSHSGEPVAGALCRLEPTTGILTLRLVGVADGNPAHYRGGTYTALFIHVLEWAAHQGMASVDLGGCEPFISKGTFQFKRKLHPVVTMPGNHFRHKRLRVTVLRDTEPVRRFLIDNPMIALDDRGGFVAVYFHDGRRPPRADLPWRTAGIAQAQHVDLDSFLHSGPRRPSAPFP
ncbi:MULTISPECIES: GNAT family N-acetyltransferase [Streptomyces]|uniref:GNAT family N-acetyltransferase n=2 Tax=Streptomyces TaxID=1883 RepID=A0ABV9J1P5_9ACTN